MSSAPVIARQSNFGAGIGMAIVVGVLVLGFVFYQNGEINLSAILSGIKYKTITIEKLALSVRVAKTPTEQAASLNGINSIRDNEGMLFVFEEDGIYSMSTKDMLFPVDIMWLDRNGVIVDSYANVSPGRRDPIKPSTRARYVLMINAGLMERNDILMRSSADLSGVR
jgi:uncharacterized membrane protein (UPF0127 family)